jgi:hypothetical protein
VLVSNQGALPETIASAPSAYVYDASNTDGLTSALHTVLSDCTHWKPNQVISASYYNTMKRDWGKSYEEILQRNLSIN